MRYDKEDFVIKDWVFDVPRRGQGTLMTGIRGCDVVPKEPLDSTERKLVAYLRWCVMNPADEREVDVPGAFFCSTPPEGWKPSELGHYPLHWYSHVMHCYEVVAYYHPEASVSNEAMDIYRKMALSMHLNVETLSQLHERLTEDRVKAGTIVS